MPDITHILHPTDFSASANTALAQAVHLARQYEAELHILHVAQYVPAYAEGPLPGVHAGSPSVPEYYEQLRAEAEERLNAVGEGLDMKNVRVRRVLGSGSTPAPIIIEYAESQPIDLIVVGTHGRRTVERFLLGSVAEEVLHKAPCDVLTARGRSLTETEPRPIQRILVPVDFSKASTAALIRGKSWAARHGAQLDLLHVIEPPAFGEAFSGAISVHELEPEVREKIAERLDNILAEAEGPDVPYELHIVEGQAGKKIVDTAKVLDADIIMMATRGHTGLRRIFLGSVTERVIRLALRPVYAVRV